jgi:hypothetical protein
MVHHDPEGNDSDDPGRWQFPCGVAGIVGGVQLFAGRPIQLVIAYPLEPSGGSSNNLSDRQGSAPRRR